ncbi:hypothetical protein M0802_003378 [Mischocyttarus mexicanus]|nr:hypothetical protein M0802_003378 [Mischocyttarus mexicanus]
MVRPSNVEANGSSSSRAICEGVGRKRWRWRWKREKPAAAAAAAAFRALPLVPTTQDQNGPTGKGSVWVGSGSVIDGNERGRALLLPSPPVVVLLAYYP